MMGARVKSLPSGRLTEPCKTPQLSTLSNQLPINADPTAILSSLSIAAHPSLVMAPSSPIPPTHLILLCIARDRRWGCGFEGVTGAVRILRGLEIGDLKKAHPESYRGYVSKSEAQDRWIT
jgi:hypothetical protein